MTGGILLLNQVTGPLFRELAEDLAVSFGGGTLLTDTTGLPAGYAHPHLRILAAPGYRRDSAVHRLWSWSLYFARALVEVFQTRSEVRLLLVSNPPFLAWVGWLSSVLRGQRYVVLVYDIYPGLLENLGRLTRGGLVARLWRWSNRLTWGRADTVITIGEYMAKNIRVMLASAEAPPVRVIPNWADGSVMHPRPKGDNWFAQQHGLEGSICVLYSGNIGATHDLGPLLEAAERTLIQKEYRYVIVGGGERWPAVQAEATRRGLTNLTLLPWQPEANLPFSLAAADIAVVTLEAGVEGHSVPSKTYFALAAGAALLVISHGKNELVDLVLSSGCGLAVPTGDAGAVVGALERFRTEPGFLAGCRANARAIQEKTFSRRNTQAYVDILRGASHGENHLVRKSSK